MAIVEQQGFLAAKMALSITDLPDELLMNIISFLDLPSEHDSLHGWSKGDVRPTLCSLAVTCRRLSTLAREFMFRDVKLATGWVSSIYPLYNTDRLGKFARICREKPDTVNRVRSLEIQADFSATPDWGESEDDRAPDLVLQMLSQSSSLTHLRLLFPGWSSMQWLRSLFIKYHQKKLFTCLRSLYVDCGSGYIPPTLFFSLCDLPSLKHIVTPSRFLEVFPDPSTAFYLDYRPCHSTSILGLGISEIERIDATDLSTPAFDIRGFFEKMPKLKELHISVPGLGVAFDNHDNAHHKSFRTAASLGRTFSPALQQTLLNSVASTLRSLSMIHPQVLVGAHDRSLLDLSHFKQLEHLKLSIHFLSPASLQDARKIAPPDSTPCAPAKDFYRLLPRSLQTLEIHYDSDQGIFYDPHHLYKTYHIEDVPELSSFANHGLPKNQALPMMYNELWTDRINNIDGDNSVRSRLGWLLAFRQVRAKALPRLTALTVRETYARDWLWDDFDLVAQHPCLFRDEVLDINVVLRVPSNWEPPVELVDVTEVSH